MNRLPAHAVAQIAAIEASARGSSRWSSIGAALGLSIAATAIGSLMATVALAIATPAASATGASLLLFVRIWFVGATLAMPLALALGTPFLAMAAGTVARRPVFSLMAGAAIGGLAALGVAMLFGDGGFGFWIGLWSIIWGAIVGEAHVLVAWRLGRR